MKKLPFSAVCNRCVFDDTPDGQRLSKKYKFFSNAPWITALQCPCTCWGDHISLTTYKDGQITGKPELLKESEAYPARLGEELVNVWVCLMWVVNPLTHLSGRPSEQGPGRAWILLPQLLDLVAAVAGRSCESSSNSSKLQSFWS